MGILSFKSGGGRSKSLLVGSPLVVEKVALILDLLCSLSVRDKLLQDLSMLLSHLLRNRCSFLLDKSGSFFKHNRLQVLQAHLVNAFNLAKLLIYLALNLLLIHFCHNDLLRKATELGTHAEHSRC